MQPVDRLKGLDVFVAVADAGSFAAAAERLHLTGSAVAKAVARLEGRLGARLFERTTRRLRLTDAGLTFQRTCVRILGELEAAEAGLAAERDEPAGRLRVDLPATFGRLCVMPSLLAFLERHPAVRLDVSFTDRFVDIVEDAIDVGVRIGGPDSWPANVGHRYLGSERLIFCAAPGYLARRGTPSAIDDLAAHDAVLYGKADGSTAAWRIAHAAGSVERRVMDGRMVLGEAGSQVAAVLAGCGVAQLATWLLDAPLRDGRLVEVLPRHATDGLALHLVWPRHRALLPRIAALREHLSERLVVR